MEEHFGGTKTAFQKIITLGRVGLIQNSFKI